MLSKAPRQPLFSPRGGTPGLGLLVVGCLVALALLASDASAGQLPVSLGAADSFAVLAGQTVTNTGFSTLNGDLGVSPGTALTGFPPGKVNGKVHATDPVANQAQSDLTTAYNDAAGRTPPNALPADVGGRTLAPGVYKAGAALELTGTLTLDARGDPNAVFVFQVGSKLTTSVSSRVNLIGGAQPGNVFWQIGSSATLGTSSVFAGTILAYTSISMNDRVTLNGRALARNGAVTLINDTITAAPPRGFRRPGPRGRTIHYAALGDSYSSGEGLGEGKKRGSRDGYLNDGGDPACDRHPKAYPRLFASPTNFYENHPIMMDLFAACSGATTENIDRKRQRNEQFTQLELLKVLVGTDLVSITIGGDDAGFADVLSHCYLYENCNNSRKFRQGIDSKLRALAGNLRRVFAKIKHAVPHATVVVLGYPHVFPTNQHDPKLKKQLQKQQECAREGTPRIPVPSLPLQRHVRFGFEPQEQDYLNKAADRLNTVILRAANATHVRFDDPTGKFIGHAHCEKKEQWINGFTDKFFGTTLRHGPGSFHPNKAGHRFYGNFLFGFLQHVVKYHPAS